MDDFKRKRLERSQDARDWSAIDALEETLDEIRKEPERQHRIAILWWTNVGTPESPKWEKHYRFQK